MSTTGQPVAGQTSGDAFAVLSGYWQGFQEVIRSLFMPFIVGNP